MNNNFENKLDNIFYEADMRWTWNSVKVRSDSDIYDAWYNPTLNISAFVQIKRGMSLSGTRYTTAIHIGEINNNGIGNIGTLIGGVGTYKYKKEAFADLKKLMANIEDILQKKFGKATASKYIAKKLGQ